MIKSKDVYYLLPPRERRFYRVLSYILHYNNLLDRAVWGYSPNIFFFGALNRIIIPYVVPNVLLFQLLYLYTRRKTVSFAVMGTIFSIIPVSILVLVSTFSAKFASYKKLTSHFMDKIHMYNYIDEHEFSKTTLIKVERNSRWTSYTILFLLGVDWLSWALIPPVNNYINRASIENKTKQYETCIYLWAPFDYEHNFKNWVIIQCINVYFVWVGCFVIIAFATLGYIFIYHLIGHIQLLKYKIKTEIHAKLSNEEQLRKLVDLIKYHAFITELFKDIQSAFGLNIAANYLHNLVGDSLMLYLIMNGNTGNLISFGLMILVYMGGLILISFVLEEIRVESNVLSDAVYNMPWEKMSVSNRKIILLMLRRVQTPLVFTASGGLKTGVRPMLSILKSTFSYYVMLNSTV